MKIKKNHKTIISVVLSLWIFFMGFELGNYTGSQGVETTTQATTAVVVTTTEAAVVTTTAAPVVTQATTTTAIADDNTDVDVDVNTDANDDTEVETTEAEVQDVSTYSTAQVIEKINEAMSNLENQTDFTATKSEDISVTVTDCSVSSLTDTVNSIVQGFVGVTEETYTFVGGVDGSGNTPTTVIPPDDINFYVSADMVTAATATQSGDNVIYSFTLVAESTTIEAGNDVPAYHSTTVGYLDLLGLDLPSIVSITNADMNYHGATMTITVDSQGRITTLDIDFPMDGSGTAKVVLVSGSASFEGGMDSSWTFTY